MVKTCLILLNLGINVQYFNFSGTFPDLSYLINGGIMINEQELIKGCKKHNQLSQKKLYSYYASKMKGVCLKYSADHEEAKDILQDGFIKVFSNINQFEGSGSLEGWIRRIIVNTAIAYYKKNKRLKEKGFGNDLSMNIENLTDGSYEDQEESNLSYKAEFSEAELLNSLQSLPDSFRIVFNLYHIENYSHKEIAKALNIEEKTSRSRLFRAKKMLQETLHEMSIEKVKFSENVKI